MEFWLDAKNERINVFNIQMWGDSWDLRAIIREYAEKKYNTSKVFLLIISSKKIKVSDMELWMGETEIPIYTLEPDGNIRFYITAKGEIEIYDQGVTITGRPLFYIYVK